ncbi:MAG: sulfotransferase [bacterium]
METGVLDNATTSRLGADAVAAATAAGPDTVGSDASADPRPSRANAAEPRLAFLVYLNRSGSTFLARLLAEHADVAVSLEAQFDDGLVRAGGGLRARDEADLDRLLDHLLADAKFSAWNVDAERLKTRLLDAGLPLTFPKFLRAALAETFAGDSASVHIYKNGRMLERPAEFRRLFPDAKVVFVLRDPRAVLASQQRSLDSRTRRPMSSSAVVTARWFRRTMRTLERHVDGGWLYVVRFEDLVADPEREVGRVLSFLGATPGRRDAEAGYADRIPEAQRHLHRNVGGTARRERTESWREELSPRDVALVESIAGPEMERHGYRSARPRLGLADRLANGVARVGGEIRFALTRARWNLVTRPRL